jgi:ribosomal-protein-alanine N-acetyltransferase
MKDDNPAIDAMTVADVDEVVAIEATAFRDPPRDAAQSGARFREELARPWARCWVARLLGREADRQVGRPVAYLLFWHVVDEIHVLDIAVYPAHRRRGIARALMDRLLSYAGEHAVRLVLLEVRRSNAAAIHLYKSLGFSIETERKRYYPNGEDALEMALRLPPVTPRREDGGPSCDPIE